MDRIGQTLGRLPPSQFHPPPPASYERVRVCCVCENLQDAGTVSRPQGQ